MGNSIATHNQNLRGEELDEYTNLAREWWRYHDLYWYGGITKEQHKRWYAIHDRYRELQDKDRA